MKKNNKNEFETAVKNILRQSDDLEGWPEVKGFDFSEAQKKGMDNFNLTKFLDSYSSTGFQATNLKKAVDIIRKMNDIKKSNKAKPGNKNLKDDGITVFLGYTSNMISSGLREIIAFLVKNKMVDVIVTTAGGIEEDIIKCLKPFVIGDFNADGSDLRQKGINRIGNIFVPNNRYIEFEKLMHPFFEKVHCELKAEGKNSISPQEIIYKLGKEVEINKAISDSAKNNSILYWAAKNNIPIFCPALTDGSFGDMLYFYKKKIQKNKENKENHENQANSEFKIDITDDIVKINDIAINAEKTGAIILGGSLPKHHIMNANMFRDGTDYTIYICTGSEGDGSMAGARPEEAVSWGKQGMEATSVMVEGDAAIIFPLVVAGGFLE
ncbi:MAG: deoxyhypusine synthase [Candidatus Woesearchaeota archaeon]